MTTNHHTPIANGAAANSSTINNPLGELDAELTAQDGRIGTLEGDMPVPSGVATEFYNGEGEFTVPAGTGASVDGHLIKDEGVSLPQRASIDFVGAGVTVTNETGGTQVSIPGGVTDHGALSGLSDDDHPQYLLKTNSPTMPPQGRLTLTSGVAITTSDVTGATTLYYTPASGNYVPCIVSGTLAMRTFTELSQATTDTTKSPAAVAADKVYDIFLWDNSGTLRATRGPAWASDTSRGTGAATSEVEFVNGFYVNKYAITNGPGAGLGILVGSVRSNASSQLVDSDAVRWVSNLYNAVPRKMRVIETTDSWTYTTNSWRQARNSAANQLDFLQCMSGGLINATVIASFSNSAGSNFGGIAVGLDSTTTPSDYINTSNYSPGAGLPSGISSYYVATSTFGRHYMAWLEYGSGSGTTTWYGDAGSALLSQAGIAGFINN